MQVEDRLAAARTDVDEHAIVVQAGLASDLRDELEHPLRVLRGELPDVAEGVDMPLGDDEEMRLRLGIDVADRDEAVALGDVVTLLDQAAKKAIVRQRGSLPR